jgi:hypothetical protein
MVTRMDDALAKTEVDASRLRMLGEEIYMAICGKDTDKARKLTGMLLELSGEECGRLLCSNVALMVHVHEALKVLAMAEAARVAAGEPAVMEVAGEPTAVNGQAAVVAVSAGEMPCELAEASVEQEVLAGARQAAMALELAVEGPCEPAVASVGGHGGGVEAAGAAGTAAVEAAARSTAEVPEAAGAASIVAGDGRPATRAADVQSRRPVQRRRRCEARQLRRSTAEARDAAWAARAAQAAQAACTARAARAVQVVPADVMSVEKGVARVGESGDGAERGGRRGEASTDRHVRHGGTKVPPCADEETRAADAERDKVAKRRAREAALRAEHGEVHASTPELELMAAGEPVELAAAVAGIAAVAAEVAALQADACEFTGEMPCAGGASCADGAACAMAEAHKRTAARGSAVDSARAMVTARAEAATAASAVQVVLAEVLARAEAASCAEETSSVDNTLVRAGAASCAEDASCAGTVSGAARVRPTVREIHVGAEARAEVREGTEERAGTEARAREQRQADAEMRADRAAAEDVQGAHSSAGEVRGRRATGAAGMVLQMDAWQEGDHRSACEPPWRQARACVREQIAGVSARAAQVMAASADAVAHLAIGARAGAEVQLVSEAASRGSTCSGQVARCRHRWHLRRRAVRRRGQVARCRHRWHLWRRAVRRRARRDGHGWTRGRRHIAVTERAREATQVLAGARHAAAARVDEPAVGVRALESVGRDECHEEVSRSGAESAAEMPHAACAGRDTMRAGASWMGMTMICRRDNVPVHGDGGVATARCRDNVPVHGDGGVATARCQLEASRGALCARTDDESDVLSVLRVRDG